MLKYTDQRIIFQELIESQIEYNISYLIQQPQQQLPPPVQHLPPQPPQPIPFPTYIPMPQGSPIHGVQASGGIDPQHYQEMKEKIRKLKGEKEELTRSLQTLELELRDSKRDNSSLEKEANHLESQLEKIASKLEKEVENVNKLKEDLAEEKQLGRRAQEELEKEREKVG